MISSIKWHITGSNSKRILSDGRFHGTRLGSSCLRACIHLVQNDTFNTDRNRGLLRKMENKTQQNQSRKISAVLKQLHRSLALPTIPSQPRPSRGAWFFLLLLLLLGFFGLFFFIFFLFFLQGGFMTYLITYSLHCFITRFRSPEYRHVHTHI